MKITRLLRVIGVILILLFTTNIFAQTNTYLIGDYDNAVDHFEGSIDFKAPFAFPYKYSCSQQIYTAEELSAINGKKINQITFKARPEGNFFDTYDEETKVYLLEIEQTEFKKVGGTFNWISVTEENLVYHQAGNLDLMNISLAEDDFEISYKLETPYTYNGGNLLVMVVHTTSAADDGLVFFDFYCYPGNVIGKPFRTVFFSNDINTFSSPLPTHSNVSLKQVAVMKIEAEPLSEITYTVTARTEGGNGEISPESAVVEANGSKEFTLKPAEGYAVDKLILDGLVDKTAEISADNKFLLSNVQNNHELVVTFKLLETPVANYTIIARVEGGHGEISPESASVEADGSKEFTLKPSEGYAVNKLILDGLVDKTAEITVDNKFLLSNIQNNHELVVTFKLLETPVVNYTITARVEGGHGEISPESANVEANGSKEFTLKPAEGYAVDKLILDGLVDKTAEISADNKFLLSNIQNNHELVVRFKSTINIIEEKDIKVKAFPNPSNHILYIEASAIVSQIEIVSLDGKLLDKQKVNDSKCQYSTSSLLDGVYLLKIFIKDKTIIKQFAVKR